MLRVTEPSPDQWPLWKIPVFYFFPFLILRSYMVQETALTTTTTTSMIAPVGQKPPPPPEAKKKVFTTFPPVDGRLCPVPITDCRAAEVTSNLVADVRHLGGCPSDLGRCHRNSDSAAGCTQDSRSCDLSGGIALEDSSSNTQACACGSHSTSDQGASWDEQSGSAHYGSRDAQGVTPPLLVEPEEVKSARVHVVYGVAGGVGVEVGLLAGGVGLGEAAELGVVVAGTHLVQAGRVEVGAGVAVGLVGAAGRACFTVGPVAVGRGALAAGVDQADR
ncbi:hypothetical protein SFUMM280S_04527 [Streptomyces fumanus]